MSFQSPFAGILEAGNDWDSPRPAFAQQGHGPDAEETGADQEIGLRFRYRCPRPTYPASSICCIAHISRANVAEPLLVVEERL
ncbi:MAG: hypothetical protein JWO19_2095 [Bryobacterales bacterium]|nr:hypothetical protein [Bryobacterales bacterium]